MSNPTKNVKLRALINAAITELYPEITIDQLILDGDTTLAAKIAEIVAAVNLRAKIADVDADMEALREELTEQIGTKAAQTVMDDVVTRLGELGALADKDLVSKADLAADVQAILDSKVPNTRKVNGKALSADISLVPSDVGADAAGSANSALVEAKKYADENYTKATGYTDKAVAALVNGAPEAMNTLGELATAMTENESVMDALNAAIGTKANQTELDAHTKNETIHITADERALWNTVKNKVETDTTYEMSVSTSSSYESNTTNSFEARIDTHTIKLVDGDGNEVSSETIKSVGEVTVDYANSTSGGLMSKEAVIKLSGIATGAEVNQNAFSNMKVGDVTIAAKSETDTLTLVSGSNVTITPDASGKQITITAKDTTYGNATASSAGLMSAGDKSKLDNLSTEAPGTLAGLTASITELNYMDGVTSNVQEQINALQSTINSQAATISALQATINSLQATINAINSALPYTITINDTAKTINFADR